MNVFNPRSWFQKPEKRAGVTSSVGNPANWLLDLLAGGSKSGAFVSDETAITLASVYTCNLILSQTIGSLKVGLYQNLPNGDTRLAPKKIEHQIIATNPSTLYTPYTLRSTMQFHLGLRGNAYARQLRDPLTGRVRELRLLHPSYVRPFFFEDELFYEITANPNGGYSKSEVVRPEDILHIRSLSTDGILGRSPIAVLRDTIGMGLSGRDYAAGIMKNQGILRGILKHPGKLTTEQVNDNRESFKKPMLNGDFPLLQNGMEFQAITLKPADAEFINTAKLTRTDICGAYRVPAHMTGDLEKATFSNIEQQSLEFMQYTIAPWAECYEQELNRTVLPYSMRGEYFFNFDLDGILRGDTATRTAYYMRARQWGWMSVNEIRRKEGMPFIDGGDTYLTPLNMVDSNNPDATGDASTDNSTSDAPQGQ